MISRDLDLMRGNFGYRWSVLPEEDQQKAISSALIASWIERDIEVVDILMTLMGWKKLQIVGITYWIDNHSYEDFRGSIEGFLMH